MAIAARPANATELRVALLTNSLSPHTLPLCEALNRQLGELIALVSAASDAFHNFPKPEASFRIVVQKSFNALRLRYSRKDFSVNEQLHLPYDTLAQLFRLRPHIVVSSQFGVRTFFAVIYRILRPRVRLIIWAALSAHTEGQRSGPRNLLRRCMLQFADGAFINGRSGEGYLRALGFKGAFCTVPYTIDDELFRSSSYAPQEQRRLLFCGRIEPTKGVLRFCKALHRWSSENPTRHITFQMIGDGPDRDQLLALAELPNLSLQVLPRMERAELPAYYQSSDIFVFPSRFDEWGVVVNEAMSAGLPVLGSLYSQAVSELIQDGVNGWIFDCENEESLLKQMDRALRTEHGDLQKMSLEARRSVSAISPEKIAARVMQMIADLYQLSETENRTAFASNLPSRSTVKSAL